MKNHRVCANDIKFSFFYTEGSHCAGNEIIVSHANVVIHTWLFAA